MVSISSALARIKDEPHVAIDPAVVECVCRESGLEWRQTVLSPPVTLSLLARQVIAGNVSCAEVIFPTKNVRAAVRFSFAASRMLRG